jgi:hypothetical protein
MIRTVICDKSITETVQQKQQQVLVVGRSEKF